MGTIERIDGLLNRGEWIELEGQAGRKTALITGAETGIGAATAVELAKRGINVALVWRRIAPPSGCMELCHEREPEFRILQYEV
ncbi:SDR family NAD(P)-dependent oxidoreductase [Cohnella rhizosphaerae]|uniref:SDR family NAD(P)-dependent oxidoreductase n=1 Tax=Cohnella rhizosphaerae TaxID=1457232 RepID=A0A9X4KWZ3_9BACL|nr:SDR family NAD(P)-dependent oxidoreductase [Cohnella rhizosphaerae]MDG0812824.1 SDR family NAD(P)-dependent oxidoreductase [Cohnella rhizosphaerae]